MNGTIVINKLTTLASTSSTVLKKIWNPLWRILSFSFADDTIYPAKTLSASIEKGILSLAYGSRFLSKIKIKGVREYSFEEGKYPQPEVLASSLSFAINDLGATKAYVSLSIPKAWAIIKTVEFPATVKENLSDVISYELDRITPFSSEDAFYDFKILDENAGKLTILIVAAKADLIKPYIEALGEKGIAVSRITVNLLGIGALCRYIDRTKDSIFVEIKKDGYEGAVFLDGSITRGFSGSFITPPRPPLVRAGEGRVENSNVDTIITEIASLADSLKGHGKSPQIMILFRDKSSTFKEMLKIRTSQPIKILNETDIKIRSESTRTELSGQYKEIPYAAIGGVLGSLWPKETGLNLLHKGYQERSKSPKSLTIILMISILAMWILYIIAPLRIEEKRLQEIDRQITLRKEEVRKIESLKKEIETLNKEISLINNFKENKPMDLNILKELTIILPKNAWLSRVRITESTVELEGYAASATGLLSKLEVSKYFKKVEFASPTFRDTRMNADRFNIKMEIEGIKKDEGTKKESIEEDEEE